MQHGSELLVEDQFVALLRLEASYQVKHIPCQKGNDGNADDASPHEDWRRKICEWCYRVVDHFRIDREVVSVAMNYFDRFLALHQTTTTTSCPCPSCQRAVDSKTFQLAAMTSLYLATKLHAETSEEDQQPPRKKKLRLLSFVDLSRGQFTAEDICSMERNMLATLRWKVHPTTPSTVVSLLLRLLQPNNDLVWHVVNELARYLSELSICMADLCYGYRASEIAYAAVLVSMGMLTERALPNAVQHRFCANICRMLHPSNERISFLMHRLRQCFWPEMLLEECEVEPNHPISLARQAGLLDVGQMMQHFHHHKLGRNGSTSSFTDVTQQAMEESPVCVSP